MNQVELVADGWGWGWLGADGPGESGGDAAFDGWLGVGVVVFPGVFGAVAEFQEGVGDVPAAVVVIGDGVVEAEGGGGFDGAAEDLFGVVWGEPHGVEEVFVGGGGVWYGPADA